MRYLVRQNLALIGFLFISLSCLIRETGSYTAYVGIVLVGLSLIDLLLENLIKDIRKYVLISEKQEKRKSRGGEA